MFNKIKEKLKYINLRSILTLLIIIIIFMISIFISFNEGKKHVTAFNDIKVYPVNETTQEDEFELFLSNLKVVLENKSIEDLIYSISEDVEFQLGKGREGFRNYYGLYDNIDQDKNIIWNIIEEAVDMGGVFTEDDMSYFVAPYTFNIDVPSNVNIKDYLIVINDNVDVYEYPDTNSKVIGILNYNLVKNTNEKVQVTNRDLNTTIYYNKVILSNGEIGYIISNNLKSPLDYRIGFIKKEEGWYIDFIIKG